MKPKVIFFFILSLGLIVSLSVFLKDEAPKEATQTQRSSNTNIESPSVSTMVEYVTEAGNIWLDLVMTNDATVLVIVASTPLCDPIPDGVTVNLDTHRKIWDTNPDILPSMMARALIRASGGKLREVQWVVPMPEGEEFSPATVRTQLIERRFFSESELQIPTEEAGELVGEIEGVVFRAFSHKQLTLSQRAVIHLGVDYFNNIYRGEIKTPLFPMMHHLLDRLKGGEEYIAGVTIDRGTLGGLPLATRFIGPYLQEQVDYLQQKSDIYGDITARWKAQADALYFENFFKNTDIFYTYNSLIPDYADDPAVWYGMYRVSREMRDRLPMALSFLEKAILLDRFYAYEYLALSDHAFENNLPDRAEEVLQRAVAILPEDPFLLLELYALYQAGGREEEAERVKGLLGQHHWSPRYYPEVVALLKE